MENVKRILILGMSGKTGGVENFIMDVYEAIGHSQIQFDFLVHKPIGGAYEKAIRRLGGQIYQISGFKNHPLRCIMQAYTFYRRHPEYTVLHLHATNARQIVYALPALFAGGKKRAVIAHSHAADSPSRLHRLFQPLCNWCATDFWACSLDAAEWFFGKRGVRRHGVRIIPNGIHVRDLAFRPEIREQTRGRIGIKPDTLVIGHVGRLSPEKNHSFLIDVFAQVRNARPGSVLLLAGDGPSAGEIRSRIEHKGLAGSVYLLGERSDIPALLMAMDLFVFPSLHEGLGTALVEAQAAGLPCLAADSVPREADCTGLVRFLPLDAGAPEWARALLEMAQSPRAQSPALEGSANDITSVAATLHDFYLHPYSGREEKNAL